MVLTQPVKAPVGSSIGFGFGYVFRNFARLLPVSFLPILLYGLALYYILPDLRLDVQDPTAGIPAILLESIADLLAALILVPLATSVYRAIIEDEPLPGIIPVIGWRELRYSFYYVFLYAGFIYLPLVAIGSAERLDENLSIIVSSAGLVALGAGSFMFVRCTLIYPASAIGAAVGVREVLELTRGNFWRLFLVFVVVAVLPSLLSTFVGFAIVFSGETSNALDSGMWQSKEQIQAMVLPMLPVIWVTTIAYTAAVAHIYKKMTGYDVSPKLAEVFD